MRNILYKLVPNSRFMNELSNESLSRVCGLCCARLYVLLPPLMELF